jgi:hypothetical protein
MLELIKKQISRELQKEAVLNDVEVEAACPQTDLNQNDKANDAQSPCRE